MAADQFSICWNNFHSNLSSGFHSLYQSEDFVDVTLAAEGQYLKAHKMVLSVCSQYFKELFIVNPCKHPIVILKDVSYNSLRDLLQFMYLGEVSVSQEELGNLMKVAELLQIKGLTEENVDSTHINHNGVRNIQISNVKAIRNEPRAFLKRPKSIKKSKLETPSKVSKVDPCTELSLSTDTDGSSNNVAGVPASVLEPELLVTPKQEPLDVVGDCEVSDEQSMPDVDVSVILDTSLGETSSRPSSQMAHCWKADPSKLTPPLPDAATPAGGLRFLTTPKGRTVVIHNGHMYTLNQTPGTPPPRDTKTTWLCVMQRKLNCAGQVTTTLPVPGTPPHLQPPPMLLSYSGHNHSQLNDIIQRLDTQTLK